jgi:hypothetical protein
MHLTVMSTAAVAPNSISGKTIEELQADWPVAHQWGSPDTMSLTFGCKVCGNRRALVDIYPMDVWDCPGKPAATNVDVEDLRDP